MTVSDPQTNFLFVSASSEARVQIYSRLKNPQWQIKVSHPFYDIWEFISATGSRVFDLNSGAICRNRPQFAIRCGKSFRTDPLFYGWHDDHLHPGNLMLAGGTLGQDKEQFDTENQLVKNYSGYLSEKQQKDAFNL